MKLQSEIKAQITRYSKELRLPVFRNEFEQIAQEAAKDQADYETFLAALQSNASVASRSKPGIHKRSVRACFNTDN